MSDMRYRITESAGFRLAGVKFPVSVKNGTDYNVIPSIWNSVPKETFDRLLSLSDSEPTGVLGVFGEKHYNGSVYTGFDYWIAASTTKPCPDDFGVIDIPAATWAVFEAKGPLPGSIQDVFKRLYSEWFATAEYARRWDVYEIEWFSIGIPTSSGYICEAWVPVVKKI